MIKRRNYFIKKGFQLNFVYKFILLLLIEALLIAGLFMYISTDTLTTGYADSRLTIDRTWKFFLVPSLHIVLIVAIGTALIGLFLFILLSHRIAGPLYRFEADLKVMASGDLTKRINVRKTDQLSALKDDLNDFVGGIDKSLGIIKGRVDDIEAAARKKGDADMVSKTSLLRSEIDKFKISPRTDK